RDQQRAVETSGDGSVPCPPRHVDDRRQEQEETQQTQQPVLDEHLPEPDTRGALLVCQSERTVLLERQVRVTAGPGCPGALPEQETTGPVLRRDRHRGGELAATLLRVAAVP